MAREEDSKARATVPAAFPWGMLIGAILVTVVLTVAALFGALHYTGVLSGMHPDAVAVYDAEPAQEDEGKEAPRQAIYVPLDPPFVVNFEGRGPARFLQISVEVMTRDAEYEELIRKHSPVIRNNLVMLFSHQTYQDVAAHEGKENLRAAALAEVRKILEDETGGPGADAVYFTSFVMQ